MMITGSMAGSTAGSTAAPVVLAVDLGTSAIKAALVTVRGEVLDWEAQPLTLQLLPDGGAEQSPSDWWEGFLTVARKMLARGRVRPEAVVAICCSTQGEGTVPVDRDGNALMNAILWMDMRGAPLINRRLRGLVNLAGASPFKIMRFIRLTGGMPSLTGKDPAAHMLLVRDCFPAVYARTHKFLNVLDYLNLRLTGRFVATVDSILTSWVTDNRNRAQIRYHPGLVRRSGIDADKFPEIVPCTAVLGPLRSDVARALGLSPTVSVVAGAIDNSAAAIGSGAIADYVPHLYLGTSSWVAAHVPHKKTDLKSALASVPCALPERYLLTALQATAGGNLTFLRDKILFCEDGLTASAANGESDRAAPDLATIDRIAAAVPPGANGVIYTPWIWGERAPVDDRHLRAGFFNLSLHNDRRDVIRAVFEGVALNTRWLMEPVKRFLDRPIPKLHLAGGGATSDVWCQIFADVLGLEVMQVKDPVQVNARGAAFIAAAALGLTTFAEVPRLIEAKRTYVPTAGNRQLYDDRFAAFVEIYRGNRGLYRTLNGGGP
jgi:xylulokinase